MARALTPMLSVAREAPITQTFGWSDGVGILAVGCKHRVSVDPPNESWSDGGQPPLRPIPEPRQCPISLLGLLASAFVISQGKKLVHHLAVQRLDRSPDHIPPPMIARETGIPPLAIKI